MKPIWVTIDSMFYALINILCDNFQSRVDAGCSGFGHVIPEIDI